ncbi:MAG: hypothetical protein ABSB82_23875 [Terriglobia bacterium]|jgi:hypothetical protein
MFWSVLGAAAYLAVALSLFEQYGPIAEAHTPQPPPLTREAQEQLPPSENEPGPPLTPKQKQDLLKSNFEKLKKDAADLAALAKSLQQEIDTSNENVLSLKVVDKAEKIEKLARKIKTAAKGQ